MTSAKTPIGRKMNAYVIVRGVSCFLCHLAFIEISEGCCLYQTVVQRGQISSFMERVKSCQCVLWAIHTEGKQTYVEKVQEEFSMLRSAHRVSSKLLTKCNSVFPSFFSVKMKSCRNAFLRDKKASAAFTSGL